MDALLEPATLAVTVRALTPILLLAYAGYLSQRAGVFNIALEGHLLLSAFFAVWGSFTFGSPAAGVLAAVAAGVAYSLLLALATLSFKADDFVVGVALNLLAVGVTGYLLRTVFDTRGSFDHPDIAGLRSYEIAGVKSVPLLAELFSGHTSITYVALLCPPVVAFVVSRTRFGLRLRGAGSHPAAAASLGVSPVRIGYGALVLCGVLGGLAGAQLSIGHITLFSTNMSAGRGWIAVVVVMLAGPSALRVLATALMFTLIVAAGLRLQTTGLPVQVTEALPFIATIVGLVASGRRRARSPRWAKGVAPRS